MYRLTAAQNTWLKTAGAVERAAFLAKGPAEAAALFDPKANEPTYLATVRGVAVAETASPDAAAVLQAAEAARAAFAATAGPYEGEPALDEVALGIDDTGRDLDAALTAHTMVIGALIPLAGLDSDNLPEILERLLEDLDRETAQAWTWLPSLARYLHLDRPERAEREAYDPERHSLLDGTGGRDSEREIAEAFVQALHDDCAYGFLAQASQPVPKWTGNGASYSWGYSQTSLHYGRSPERAIQAALAWGEATWNTGKPPG